MIPTETVSSLEAFPELLGILSSVPDEAYIIVDTNGVTLRATAGWISPGIAAFRVTALSTGTMNVNPRILHVTRGFTKGDVSSSITPA